MAGRGGRRQGQPGKSYTNRTDLGINRAGQSGTSTAAAGGVQSAPPPPAPAPMFKTPQDVPKLDDPTARPGEPVTHGLSFGPGGGPEAIGPVPIDPTTANIQAAYLANPTPELRRAIMMMSVVPGGLNG